MQDKEKLMDSTNQQPQYPHNNNAQYNAHNNPMAQPGSTGNGGYSGPPSGNGPNKVLMPVAIVLGLTTVALAAALVANRTGDDAASTQVQSAVATQPAPAAVRAPVQSNAVAQRTSPAPVATPAPVSRPVAQACVNCGVVESVTTVQRQGEVNGIGNTQIGVGTVAGGLIGGLLGNQIGNGSGRTAATVIGAAGGAYAGNAIEKNTKKYTAYQMRIRMHDGSYRTVEQGTAIATGSQVVVEGNRVRAAG